MTRHVVCIHDGPWINWRTMSSPPSPPQRGQVYTVIDTRLSRRGWPMYQLAEIELGWFAARHFRPVRHNLTSLLMTETIDA